MSKELFQQTSTTLLDTNGFEYLSHLAISGQWKLLTKPFRSVLLQFFIKYDESCMA